MNKNEFDMKNRLLDFEHCINCHEKKIDMHKSHIKCLNLKIVLIKESLKLIEKEE